MCIGNLIQAKAMIVYRDPLHAGAIHVENVGDYYICCHYSAAKKVVERYLQYHERLSIFRAEICTWYLAVQFSPNCSDVRKVVLLLPQKHIQAVEK